jgi:hypothetical protein
MLMQVPRHRSGNATGQVIHLCRILVTPRPRCISIQFTPTTPIDQRIHAKYGSAVCPHGFSRLFRSILRQQIGLDLAVTLTSCRGLPSGKAHHGLIAHEDRPPHRSGTGDRRALGRVATRTRIPTRHPRKGGRAGLVLN